MARCLGPGIAGGCRAVATAQPAACLFFGRTVKNRLVRFREVFQGATIEIAEDGAHGTSNTYT
ncbi:hypothetical protein [uncultured Tateyamaria sp.]|uniref:hypothetical protein n=1 Tax=uncultured Tateyamaria sp. TaxID=455651 RepID=UPI0026122443|nr:hypothetical protein [uncultured Tateyamaria sp.]